MIAIIDYDAGNLTSVERAVTHIGYSAKVTNNLEEIRNAERIIFPGVGAAGSAMESLRRLGLDKALKNALDQGKPILGICVGSQIITSHSDENDTECLGFVDGSAKAFSLDMKDDEGHMLKIPHMGWNSIDIAKKHPVIEGITPEDEFYFVHSFYPSPKSDDHVLATTDYGVKFASVIGYDNLIATQFHLEKSGRPGLTLLKNFCRWQPC